MGNESGGHKSKEGRVVSLESVRRQREFEKDLRRLARNVGLEVSVGNSFFLQAQKLEDETAIQRLVEIYLQSRDGLLAAAAGAQRDDVQIESPLGPMNLRAVFLDTELNFFIPMLVRNSHTSYETFEYVARKGDVAVVQQLIRELTNIFAAHLLDQFPPEFLGVLCQRFDVFSRKGPEMERIVSYHAYRFNRQRLSEKSGGSKKKIDLDVVEDHLNILLEKLEQQRIVENFDALTKFFTLLFFETGLFAEKRWLKRQYTYTDAQGLSKPTLQRIILFLQRHEDALAPEQREELEKYLRFQKNLKLLSDGEK